MSALIPAWHFPCFLVFRASCHCMKVGCYGCVCLCLTTRGQNETAWFHLVSISSADSSYSKIEDGWSYMTKTSEFWTHWHAMHWLRSCDVHYTVDGPVKWKWQYWNIWRDFFLVDLTVCAPQITRETSFQLGGIRATFLSMHPVYNEEISHRHRCCHSWLCACAALSLDHSYHYLMLLEFKF